MRLLDRKVVDIGKYRFMDYLGKSWALIFVHDIRQHLEFWRKKEEAYYFYDKEKPWKYSILTEAMNWEHPGEKYEFIFEFLDSDAIVHWAQTKYPLNQTGTKADDFVGYSPQSLSKTYWNGLGVSINDCTLLCGLNVGYYWYYSLGTVSDCWGYGINDFPGAENTSKFVRLWMRVLPIRVNGFNTMCARNRLSNNFICSLIVSLLYS